MKRPVVPTKRKIFRRAKFSPEAIKRAAEALGVEIHEFDIDDGMDVLWSFSEAAELTEAFSLYRDERQCAGATVIFYAKTVARMLRVNFNGTASSVIVRAETRAEVEDVLHIFEAALSTSLISDDKLSLARRSAVKIFVGHGRNQAWRDLKDHLVEMHNYKVVAFETSPRAGQTVTDVLASIEEEASFALIVMTGENESADGTRHARENVVHEIGLFQGVLGPKKVVVLLEDGCEEFSNRAGIQYIPFRSGNVKEAFGDVLATLKREFG